MSGSNAEEKGATAARGYSYDEALAASIGYFHGNELAARVFVDKYALRDNEQNLVERTPHDMHVRIAKEFARVEARKFKRPLSEAQIFDLLKGFGKIIPQGSPMYGIGNQYQTISLSNCFVIDSPLDSYTAILKADEELAQIAKRRGGDGVDVANIRPAGMRAHNAARTATGTIPFCKRFSNTIREVGQNGRRGALMISQSIHHPESVIPWDAETDGPEFFTEIRDKDLGQFSISSRHYNPKRIDFATMKYDRANVTGANVSLRVTDEFLNAVERGEKYQQRWPVEDKVHPALSKYVDASAVWDKIIYSAWQTAEPGVLFWDSILRESPADCYADVGFRTISTNPCVTSDTWVLTADGPRQVSELVGRRFEAVVNGKKYRTESKGFFPTGVKRVKRVKLNRGQVLRVTEDHRIMTPDGWKKLSDLSVGSKVLLSNHRGGVEWEGVGNASQGFLVGSLLGDGCFSEGSAKLTYWGPEKAANHRVAKRALVASGLAARSDAGTADDESASAVAHDRVHLKSVELAKFANGVGVNADKILDDRVERTSSDFYLGFLRGWFDADGTVGASEAKGSFSVYLSSSVLSNLQVAQRMLARLGIVGSIYENRREAGFRHLPDGLGGTREYWCDAQHELVISRDNIGQFASLVGFGDPSKAEKLKEVVSSYTRGPNAERFEAAIAEIADDGDEQVYDCTVETVHEFDGNGVRVHNCGEIPLSAYDSCRLLVLNLFAFVKNPFTKDAYFDFAEFYEHAQIAQRLMDNLVDLEHECIERIIAKIDSDPEPAEIKARERKLWENIRAACLNGRRTGTGITALGDAIAACNVGYGSEEGVAMTERIYRTLKFGAYRASIDMAKELGAFPVWDHQKEKGNPFLNRIREESVDLGGGRTVSGADLWQDMKQFGRRNIALLTTAPTGSVSLLTKLTDEYGTSSGIEPQYDVTPYTRKKKGNPGDRSFRSDEVDQNGDHWMHFKVYCSALSEWMKVTGETDHTKSPWWGHCASQLDWNVRVRLQAAAQRHVDHSISSTVNLPNDVTVAKVKEIYETAWKAGCKGITVYRDGCRTGVLVKDAPKKGGLPKTTAPKRPETVPCDVYHIKAKGEEYFVLVGLFDGGDPYEVFAGKNGMIGKDIKRGSLTKKARGRYDATFEDGSTLKDVAEHLSDEEEAVTRMVSTSLRHGADIEFIVHQLEKTKGALTGFAKALARALKKYIPDGKVVAGEVCEQEGCGGQLVRQDGCKSCRSCGWTKCS